MKIEWSKTLMTLATGALGALLFQQLALPLPWLLGSLTTVTALALAGAGPALPDRLRNTFLPVVAVALGAAFTPGMAEQLDTMAISLPVVLIAALGTGAFTIYLLRRVGGQDPATAFFAGVPGAINQVMLLAPRAGAHMPAVCLHQGIRLFLVVALVPVAVTALGDTAAPVAPEVVKATSPPLLDLLLLLGCCLAGPPLARRAGLPTPILVGPLLLSAGLHLTGLCAASVPGPILLLAQLVIGSAIGARFARLDLRAMQREAALAVGATLAVLVGLSAVAFALAWASGLSPVLCLLILAPGGLGEMALLALATGIDPAYVAAHHVIRVLMLYLLVPVLAQRIGGVPPAAEAVP